MEPPGRSCALYAGRDSAVWHTKGVCLLRDDYPKTNTTASTSTELVTQEPQVAKSAEQPAQEALREEIYEEIHADKWQQLRKIYPEIHICPDAQSILIRPRDVVVLAAKYHELATNSFVLHSYYNYRQLLLFRYAQKDILYYLGVPGVYYEREQRIAQMFGFEASKTERRGCSRMRTINYIRDAFGYYMKRVEI